MNNVDGQLNGQVGQVASQVIQQVAQAAQQPAQIPNQVVYNQPVANNQALFSQEQLNSIISGRINPLNQKISELNTQLAQSQQLANSYLNELNGYKQRDTATKAGVPAQFVDFAVFEANKLAVNGKSFEDAMKEYVSANGSLFGVANQTTQTTVPNTPAAQQVTQGVANPAQSAQTQQSVQTIQQPAQTVQQAAQPANIQTVGAQQTLQNGSTLVQFAGNPATSNVDGEVDAFLKARGLRK
jgi:hypothetical protein